MMLRRTVLITALALVLVLVMAAQALAYGDGWFPVTSPTTEALNAVSFPVAGTGWAVGAGGTIVTTSDGGFNWTQQVSGTLSGLNGVSFVDTTHGWAVGQSGTILATTDGGAHWSAQTSGTGLHLHAVCFADSSHGWAVGMNALILQTVDGGTTWTQQSLGSSHFLLGVSFADSLHGWVVGQSGYIAATSDGGATWVQQASGIPNDMYGVSFPDAAHGWASSVAATVLSTADAGAHWAVSAPVAGETLYGVSFADARHGWVVGNGGTIVATTDGGAHWYPQTSRTEEDLRGICCPDASFGWAVGVQGTIRMTGTGGWPVPTETITTPTAASSWPTNTSQTVSWTLDKAVEAGEFKVWQVSTGGTWYVGKQVAPVAGQTSYSATITVPATMPPGPGYKAYVYYRPTVGSGSWTATARSAAFTVTAGPPAITVTAPVAGAGWPSGSTQSVAWKLSNPATSGEFKVWLVSSGGAWYVGKVVPFALAATTYTTSVPVSCPAGSYQAYVYWRPTLGAGGWVSTARSAVFSVTPLFITRPTALSSWKVGTTENVTWTMNPAVSVGEFKVWLVSGSSWYIGKVVAAASGTTGYATSVTVPAAAGTYKAYVYYRPTVGSGSWTVTAQSPGFTVVP